MLCVCRIFGIAAESGEFDVSTCQFFSYIVSIGDDILALVRP